jgi:outer membrane cobalamin receptor
MNCLLTRSVLALAFTLLVHFSVFAQNKPAAVADTLTTKNHQLNEVSVHSSFQKMLKESPGNISVINVREFYNSNVAPVQLLKQVSGIKIKQDGGYGSRTQFFINGSTGKQIKFFLDGMPIDNVGESEGINNLSIEQIERIEIHKGIIPVELGADALGGAINIISRKDKIDYLDLSYAISSFHTHRSNLAAKKYWTNNFYTSVQASVGYSKNNYAVTVGIPNQFYNLEERDVKRFHDRYKNKTLGAEIGVIGKTWADQLALLVNYNSFDRQLQHNLTMTQPYGMATYGENLYKATLSYQKNNLFKGFGLSSQLSFNKINGLSIDTSANVYIWDGSVFDRRLKTDEGELEKAKYLHIYTNLINERFIATWQFNENHKLSFVNTLQHYNRTGEDTLALKGNGGIDFYNKPSTMLKNVAGIGFTGSLLKNRLRYTTAVKHFYAKASSYEMGETNHIKIDQNVNDITYNLGLTYPLNNKVLLKASYERALRLPDVEESFGNLMLIKPNPNLRPEKSTNFNLNVLVNLKRMNAEITGFSRNVEDLIFLQTNTRGSGMSKNLYFANARGVEMALDYHLLPSFKANLNATYQDMRNQGSLEGEAGSERYINARIPNIPYLLGNVGLNYTKPNLRKSKLNLQCYINGNYTHEYFLYWEADGDKATKNRIPTQLLLNAGVSGTFQNDITLSLECFNLGNQKSYDNYNVQLPGRSFSLKARYYLTQLKNK